MNDLPAKRTGSGLDAREPDELVLDAADERELERARERLTERLRLLWGRRRWLTRLTAGGLLLATALAFLLPKSYQATARLMPPNQNSGLGAAMLASLAGRAGGSLTSLAESALGVKTTGDLFVGILGSETVEDDLIAKFDLKRVYHTHYIEDTRTALAEHSAIGEDRKSGIITITVTDRDPKRAAAMAREYVRELNWVMSHLSTSSAHRERVFLEGRLKQVKASLEEAEKQFSAFASRKGAIDVPAQGKAMVTAAAKLQGELIAVESELQGFRQIYTDGNVRVRSLQARVNKLRSALEKIGGKTGGEYSTAGELYPSLRQLPLLGVSYADLLRRVKVQEAVFETLTQEYELAKVEEARSTPNVEELDQPQVPQKKSFPPRLLIMALGTTLSLAAGTVWLLASAAWEAADSRDPRKALAIEVWADVQGGLAWPEQNGSRLGRTIRFLRNRFHRREISGGE